MPRPCSDFQTNLSRSGPTASSASASPSAATTGLERQAVSPSTLRPSKGQTLGLTSMSAFLETSPVIGSAMGCPVVLSAGAPADFTASAAAGAVDRADRWNAFETAGAAKRVAAEGRAAAARNERKGVAIESRGIFSWVKEWKGGRVGRTDFAPARASITHLLLTPVGIPLSLDCSAPSVHISRGSIS